MIDSEQKLNVVKFEERITVPALTVADLIRFEKNNATDPVLFTTCFKFEIERIDGCSDEFTSTLDKKVLIKTQPPIDKSIIDIIEQEYKELDDGTQQFKVCIPPEKMPRNVPIDMVFYAVWNSNTNKDAPT